jgi:hypothetical protein
METCQNYINIISSVYYKKVFYWWNLIYHTEQYEDGRHISCLNSKTNVHKTQKINK